MASRKCSICGHIENEYTFFCTECGARTEEFSEKIEANQDVSNISANVKPSHKVSDVQRSDSNFTENMHSKAVALKKTSIVFDKKWLYILSAVTIALSAIAVLLALPKKIRDANVADENKTVVMVNSDEDVDSKNINSGKRGKNEDSFNSAGHVDEKSRMQNDVLAFDNEVGFNCKGNHMTLANEVASFEYELMPNTMINTPIFSPTDTSIFVETVSELNDGTYDYTDELQFFYVNLYRVYNSGETEKISAYNGRCDYVEGGIGFAVIPGETYHLTIETSNYPGDAMLVGHGHIYSVFVEEQAVQDNNNTEPITMHYYEEMYYDQTYVLDYTLYFTHDEKGRIETVRNFDSNQNLTGTVEQSYDEEGNCTRQYTLGMNIEGLYLDYQDQVWENGAVVKTLYGAYTRTYENDGEGRPLKCYFYENGNCYMLDESSYDSEGRTSEVYRENYAGGWTVTMTYYYEGLSDKPSYVVWNHDDGSYGQYEYKYTYDSWQRLIQSIEYYYYDGELSSKIEKTYEY